MFKSFSVSRIKRFVKAIFTQIVLFAIRTLESVAPYGFDSTVVTAQMFVNNIVSHIILKFKKAFNEDTFLFV